MCLVASCGGVRVWDVAVDRVVVRCLARLMLAPGSLGGAGVALLALLAAWRGILSVGSSGRLNLCSSEAPGTSALCRFFAGSSEHFNLISCEVSGTSALCRLFTGSSEHFDLSSCEVSGTSVGTRLVAGSSGHFVVGSDEVPGTSAVVAFSMHITGCSSPRSSVSYRVVVSVPSMTWSARAM